MEYQVLLEFDPASRRYTASVPGLSVVVDATSRRTAVKLAREAIALYLDEADGEAPLPIRVELVTVKV